MTGLLLDKIRVRIAPGADLAAASSTWSFEDITSYVRYSNRIRVDRGRRNEGGAFTTSIMRLRVDNSDGRFARLNPAGAWFGELSRNTPIIAEILDSSVWHERFSGFASFQPRWNVAGKDDAFAEVEAYGLLHRQQQGEQPLNSAAFRSLSMSDHVVAYWPCEDGSESTEAASPVDGVAPMVPSGVEFGASREQSDSILYGASQVMKIPDPSRNVMGRVPNHTPGDVYVVTLAWLMPETATSDRAVMDVRTTSGDLARWQIRVSSTTFQVRAWDADDTEVVNSTEAVGDVFGRWVRAELRIADSSGGGDVVWRAELHAVDAAQTRLNDLTDTESSVSKGRITRAGVNGPAMSQERYAGHIAVLTGTATELPAFLSQRSTPERHGPYHGFTGELAADRFERLCDELGLQCSVIAPTGGLRVPGESGANASAPDAAALDITGDLDLRGWVAADTWSIGVNARVVSKWESSGDERSYSLIVGSTAELGLQWSTDGTLGAVSSVTTDLVPLPADEDFLALRATLDVDNGASGHDITFYVGPSLDGPWDEIGSETRAGTTSVHSGTADLYVGATDDDSDLEGVVRGARVYDGIGGTLVADPDFTEQTVGASSFDDDQGNTWTVNGNAAVVRADDSMPMGPQPVDILTAQFGQIVNADRGEIGEDGFGLFYRTRTSLYSQSAQVAIPSGGLFRPPQPADDTQQLVNDVTAERPDGTSVRAVDDDSVTDEGTFDTKVTANTSTDDWLRQVAYWRLHRGILPEYRWPQLSFALHRNEALVADWLAAEPGDRVTAVHQFDQLTGVDIDQLAVGWSEVFDQFEWEVTLNCRPASLENRVAVFGTSRFDAADSSTSGSFDAGTDTSLTVTSTGQPWVNSTDHASEFPFEIKVSGVVLNVTAISSATSPQTFTVDQTPTNGVTKTIDSGSAVRLASPAVFAL